VGYAWFSFAVDRAAGTSSALFDENGEMTAVGRYYASVRTDNPSGDQSIQADYPYILDLTVPSTSPGNSTNKSCPSFRTPTSLPGKKGACMTLREEGQQGSWVENLPRVESLLPYWNYNWGREGIDAQPDDIEFLPMQWGGATDSATLQQLLDEQVVPHISTGLVRHVLGFNQPDQADQANMSVERAIELWPQLEALGLPLVSPSCANPHGAWMEQYMGADLRKIWVAGTGDGVRTK
jgi:hypothetical protein